MAHISGITGSVAIGTATATGINHWSLDYIKDTIESTDFADAGIKSYILAGSGWSGSFNGYKDGIALVLSTATVSLVLNESTTAGQTFSGAAYIIGFHNDAPFNGIVTYSYDFQGTGALSVATA